MTVALLGLCIVLVSVLLLDRRTISQLRTQLRTHLDTSGRRDVYLDYLIRYLHLNVADPYIDRPSFEEKRCYHCNYPIYAQTHDPECVWLKMSNVTRELYKPANSRDTTTTAGK